MLTKEKIMDWAQASEAVKAWKSQGEKVVFTNGCFDLLHLGHVDYLEQARRLGHRLAVGLNDDPSVSRLKGPFRPLNNLYARARVLAALAFVDLVVPFEEDTPLRLVEALLPDILVKGSDYAVEQIVGAPAVLANGGQVLTISLTEGYSTTGLVGKIKKAGGV